MADTLLQQQRANQEAFRRLCAAEPVVEGVQRAIDALPGMTPITILTSGPSLPWEAYVGGQRAAIIGGALFEGLARDIAEAEHMLQAGRIRVESCHDHGCVGSLAGIYTASMPVFVVRDRTSGSVGYCNLYEGKSPRRLNYGIYDDIVRERLLYLQSVVAPVIGDALQLCGGVALKPIMVRALHMGDELHSRNAAASLLFACELFPHLLKVAETKRDAVTASVGTLTEDQYFFLRLSMAAAKATADAARGIEASSIVTAMCLNCREFAIQISGLDGRWLNGPLPTVDAQLFEGHTEDEITWMGGDSPIVETIGLGGFAQAAAFPLQRYQGGSPEAMVDRNLDLYRITVGEHKHFQIPFLGYRGTPTGIDVFKVVDTGVVPVMDMGIAGRNGGQIGAGIIKASKGCFELAVTAYEEKYREGMHTDKT